MPPPSRRNRCSKLRGERIGRVAACPGSEQKMNNPRNRHPSFRIEGKMNETSTDYYTSLGTHHYGSPSYTGHGARGSNIGPRLASRAYTSMSKKTTSTDRVDVRAIASFRLAVTRTFFHLQFDGICFLPEAASVSESRK